MMANMFSNNNNINNDMLTDEKSAIYNDANVIQITKTRNNTTPPPKEQVSLLHSNASDAQTNKGNLLVHIFVILFGIGSWLGVYAVYVQLPVMVETAPERWTLPSYIAIIVNIGNIGPLFYILLRKYISQKLIDSYLTYGLFTIACLSAFLAIFFSADRTIMVYSQERSIPLFILTFIFALVSSIGAVIFIPYMGRFRHIYMITYLIGDGLSGCIISIFSYAQGTYGHLECIPNNSTDGPKFIRYSPPPRFGTNIYFTMVFLVQVLCFIAFILLHNLKICNREYDLVKVRRGNGDFQCETNSELINNDNNNIGTFERIKKITTFQYRLLLSLFGICIFATYGVFPAIISFLCLPYGNVVYLLSCTLSFFSNPITCCLALFYKHTSIRMNIILTILTILITSYLFTAAVLSPTPPLVGTIVGDILVIVCSTVIFGLFSYVRLSVTAIIQQQVGKSLVWVGVVQQFGTSFGAIFMFSLINFTNIFVAYEPC